MIEFIEHRIMELEIKKKKVQIDINELKCATPNTYMINFYYKKMMRDLEIIESTLATNKRIRDNFPNEVQNRNHIL